MAHSHSHARGHAGHSHGHAHSHDNTFLVSKNKNDAGVRITRIGLYVNLGMAVSKGIGGYAFHSQGRPRRTRPCPTAATAHPPQLSLPTPSTA